MARAPASGQTLTFTVTIVPGVIRVATRRVEYGQVNAPGTGGADQGGAPNIHILYDGDGIVYIFDIRYHKFMRQHALVDDLYGPSIRMQPDGPDIFAVYSHYFLSVP